MSLTGNITESSRRGQQGAPAKRHLELARGFSHLSVRTWRGETPCSVVFPSPSGPRPTLLHSGEVTSRPSPEGGLDQRWCTKWACRAPGQARGWSPVVTGSVCKANPKYAVEGFCDTFQFMYFVIRFKNLITLQSLLSSKVIL